MLPFYLPYHEQPSWTFHLPIVDELTIHAFGILVALALIVGTWVSRWHGTSRGQDPIHVVDLATWTVIGGFIGAHLVSVIFYFPERLREDPLQLLYVWNGLSSFGGFLGGAVGAYVYIKRKGLGVLPSIDTMMVGLAPAWILGRLGCTIAHDHPGRSTEFFLAFDHPTRGPIHDLGFYEFLFAICVTGLVFLVRRLRWPDGSMVAVVCIAYAPVRFGLDFLRSADATYGGLTPGQWLSFVMLFGGVALLKYSWSRGRSAPKGRGADGRETPSPAGDEAGGS